MNYEFKFNFFVYMYIYIFENLYFIIFNECIKNKEMVKKDNSNNNSNRKNMENCKKNKMKFLKNKDYVHRYVCM